MKIEVPLSLRKAYDQQLLARLEEVKEPVENMVLAEVLELLMEAQKQGKLTKEITSPLLALISISGIENVAQARKPIKNKKRFRASDLANGAELLDLESGDDNENPLAEQTLEKSKAKESHRDTRQHGKHKRANQDRSLHKARLKQEAAQYLSR